MKDLKNQKIQIGSLVTKDKSFLIVVLIYSASIFIEWFVVFTSMRHFPVLYDPSDWDPRSIRFIFFGLQRSILLLLLPIGTIISWLAWHFLGYVFVAHAFIPYHKGSFLTKLTPQFFQERLTQNYFLVRSESSDDKSFKTIVEASMLPFSALLSISILISRDILHDFPTFIKQPSFGLQRLILLSSSVFTNFTLFIIVPILALVAPIWILEGSGLRYYDPAKKIIVAVVEDYKVVVSSVLGLGAITGFISLLYDIMIYNGLGFDYVLGYLFFTILLLYPSTLLVTAIYIHFSKDKSIEKVIKKMRNNGFSLPQVTSIDLKE
jgi:hypothetical protein